MYIPYIFNLSSLLSPSYMDYSECGVNTVDQILPSKQKIMTELKRRFIINMMDYLALWKLLFIFYKKEMSVHKWFITTSRQISPWDLRQLRKTGTKPIPQNDSFQVSLDKKIPILTARPSAALHACLQGSYSRPEGAPALCDDPRELCQPPGIHLEPLQRVISARTPCPVMEVIFIKACLQARNRRVEHSFIPHAHVDSHTQSMHGTAQWLALLTASTLLGFVIYLWKLTIKVLTLERVEYAKVNMA